MRSFKWLVGFLLLCFSVVLFAAPADQLVAIFKKIDSLQGQFVQTIYDQRNQPLATSKGAFVIQRPDQFRWDVQTPLAQLTIADGKTVWLYQPDLEQVTVSPMTQKIAQTPLAILSGSVTALTENYKISAPQTNQFLLVAKDKSGAFQQILLQMSGSIIQQMDLFDALGQKTLIQFSDVKVNATINNSAFRFVIPKGVDIIKN